MCAVMKSAFTQIWRKIRESILKVFFQDNLHLIGVERGETRCVRHKGAIGQCKQFYVAGCMTAPPQPFRNLSGENVQIRGQAVQNAAFSDAGVPGKGHSLSGNQRFQLLHTSAGHCAGGNHVIPGMGIDLGQAALRLQVTFIHTDDHRNILIACDGSHTVDQKRLRHRNGLGHQQNQIIQIGNCRPDKTIGPRQNLLDHSLPAFHGNGNPITDQRADSLLSESAPGFTFYQSLGGLHIVEPAESLHDPARICHVNCSPVSKSYVILYQSFPSMYTVSS